MRTRRIYVDSDVIISSLISNKGAAYKLLSEKSGKLYISNYSIAELEIVTKRLQLGPNRLTKLIKTLNLIKLDLTKPELQLKYGQYIKDPDDAHIIGGAVDARAKFLISYNTRHYLPEKIKRNLKIILLTPGWYLHYLRSLV